MGGNQSLWLIFVCVIINKSWLQGFEEDIILGTTKTLKGFVFLNGSCSIDAVSGRGWGRDVPDERGRDVMTLTLDSDDGSLCPSGSGLDSVWLSPKIPERGLKLYPRVQPRPLGRPALRPGDQDPSLRPLSGHSAPMRARPGRSPPIRARHSPSPGWGKHPGPLLLWSLLTPSGIKTRSSWEETHTGHVITMPSLMVTTLWPGCIHISGLNISLGFPWVLHCPAREASSWLPSVRQLQNPVKGSLMTYIQPIRTRPRVHWPISCQVGQAPHSALMPGSEKLRPGSGVQVSGVTGQASNGEDRIRPIREQQYPQWPISGESWERSPTPGSRPASMDLATEAWRPRGRWAGTRRPGPHQTQPLAWDLCTNGRPAPGLAPASSENTEREENVVKFPARKISLSCSFIPKLEQVSVLNFTSHKHRSVLSLSAMNNQDITNLKSK